MAFVRTAARRGKQRSFLDEPGSLQSRCGLTGSCRCLAQHVLVLAYQLRMAGCRDRLAAAAKGKPGWESIDTKRVIGMSDMLSRSGRMRALGSVTIHSVRRACAGLARSDAAGMCNPPARQGQGGADGGERHADRTGPAHIGSPSLTTGEGPGGPGLGGRRPGRQCMANPCSRIIKTMEKLHGLIQT
jgi:hypothetical protein